MVHYRLAPTPVCDACILLVCIYDKHLDHPLTPGALAAGERAGSGTCVRHALHRLLLRLVGRNTLVLQYLFQCKCPAGSEQVRYAEFTVLASACRWPKVEDMSADGRYLLITEQAAPATTYRLDLTTGARSDMTLTNAPWTAYRFLSDDLVLAHERGSRYVLIDAQTGRQVSVRWQYADALTPTNIGVLQHAFQIVVLYDVAIALADNPLSQPDQNLVLYKADQSYASLQEQLRAAGVTTPLTRPGVPYSMRAFASERGARHQQLWADTNGIHAVGSNRLLRPTDFTANPQFGFFAYMPVGWTAGDQAVVYASPTRYLIEHWRLPLAPVDYFPVPQPVLLLQAPQIGE